MATIGYVGNLGTPAHSPSPMSTNWPSRFAEGGTYPFPALPGVNIQPQLNEATINFVTTALQLSLERRLKNGLSGFANYTYAHNITNATVD